MGKVKEANSIIKSAINYLNKKNVKKLFRMHRTPIAIFAFKSIKTIKSSKIFLDPNLILANAAMRRYHQNNAS